MITVVMMLNVMVFCVMMDVVVCGLPPGNQMKPPGTNCHLYNETELAKGKDRCPRGRQREYTTYNLPYNGPSKSAFFIGGDLSPSGTFPSLAGDTICCHGRNQ